MFSDNLVSRIFPKIDYNVSKDEFIVVWVEIRSGRKQISQSCFERSSTFSYTFGADSTFVGYAILNASTLSVIKQDIIRTEPRQGDLYNVRKVAFNTEGSMREIYTYEYLDSISGVDVSCDKSSGVCSLVVSGKYAKAELTCYKTDPISASISINQDDFSGIFHLYDFEFSQDTPLRRISSIDSQTSNPAIKFDPISKLFLVVWEDLQNNNNVRSIKGRIISKSTATLSPIISISENTGYNATKPFISYDDVNQRFFVVWQDSRNTTVSVNGIDIYGQYVDSDGSLRGLNYAISNSPANQLSPVIAYNLDKNQFFAVWKDARNTTTTGSDIYGQIFSLGQPQLEFINFQTGQPIRPAVVDLGSTSVGKSLSDSVGLKNTGDKNLRICEIFGLEQPFYFSDTKLISLLIDGDQNTCINLAPGTSIYISFEFKPSSAGLFSSQITVYSDGGTKKLLLQASSASLLDVELPRIDFGTVFVGEQRNEVIVFRNTSNLRITLSKPILEDYANFSIVKSIEDLPFPYLDPTESIGIVVGFKPTREGEFKTRFIMTTTSPDNPYIVYVLTGKAINKQSINNPSGQNPSSQPIESTTPPSVKSGGGGGCSMSKGGQFDAGWLLILFTAVWLRFFRKERKVT